jgi:hypothetical protein
MPKIAPALLMFAPEHWGQIDRFQHFWSTTYEFDEREQRAVAGVRAHFDKFRRLNELAKKLLPSLQIDRTQLHEQGFTPADNAAELATIIEAAILELYSSVDCAAKVSRAIYGPGTRGFRDSTRNLFQNVMKLMGSFPEELKPLFKVAPWYWPLLHLRDELTHLATGSVHLDDETGFVRYFHRGLKQGEVPLIIDNIFGWLEQRMEQVNKFLGMVFLYLNGTLKDKPVFQICGIVEGRVLHRYLRPVAEITFNSGMCGAWVWFERPENPTCPFKDHCGAYLNKAPQHGWEISTSAA